MVKISRCALDIAMGVGYLLFTLDYIAIMALFAMVMHLAMQALNRYFYIRNV